MLLLIGIPLALLGLAALVMYLAFSPLKMSKGKNPFAQDRRKEPAPVDLDQKRIEEVTKDLYKADKVPKDLDAIVVGSGIGGLGAAAIMAAAGKKVLVLEQHDKAGGCCHAFDQDGYEFDSGIHYLGNSQRSLGQFCIEQLTEGQLQWAPMEDAYDVAVLNGKQYPFYSGLDRYREQLHKTFPNDHKAIDEYLAHLEKVRKASIGLMLIKVLPMWAVKLFNAVGLLNLFTKGYFKYARRSLWEVLCSLTDNTELRAVLAYSYGDYGCAPSDASFAIHAGLIDHYMEGACYPLGGSNEIVYQFVKVITRAGGKVLVKGRVKQIVVENGEVAGVVMDRDNNMIKCKTVISDAGLKNTFGVLCPELKHKLPKNLTSGMSCMSLFVGLKGSKEELNLKGQNYWVLAGEDLDGAFRDFDKKTREDILAGDFEYPVIFASFPSAKDPITQQRQPNNSTCTVVAPANFEWFKDWESDIVGKRDAEYEALKGVLADKMWKAVLKLYPHLEDKVDSFDAGSPITNKYYLNSPDGEIYGLDHNTTRFSPMMLASLRPPTDVKGLFITGQDVMTCGFYGAMYGSILCASSVLERNLFFDLIKLKKECRKKAAQSKKVD